jgi:hypothetical protein
MFVVVSIALLLATLPLTTHGASCSKFEPGLHYTTYPYNATSSVAYPYLSGPRTFFTNSSLRLIYIHHKDVSKVCNSDELKWLLFEDGTIKSRTEYVLLLDGKISKCYPEEAAKSAFEVTSFKIRALLTVNKGLKGTKPILLWKYNAKNLSATIPVFEVDEVPASVQENWRNAQICLSSSDNPYDNFNYRGNLILLGVLCMVLAIWKLVLCFTRINGSLPVSYHEQDCSLMDNAATLVLVFESVSSVACIGSQGLDPWGLLHVLDYPAIRLMTTVTHIFPFVSFFVMACVLQDAVLDMENSDQGILRDKRRWNRWTWFEFAVGFSLMSITVVIDILNFIGDWLRLEKNYSSSEFAVSFYIAYASLTGIYYFVQKSRILKLFQRMPVNLIEKNLAQQIDEMSNSLFLSGYCIFGYVLFMIIEVCVSHFNIFPFFAWSIAVACLNGAGILQVCAIQRGRSSHGLTKIYADTEEETQPLMQA